MTSAIVKNTDTDWGFRIVRGSKAAAKRMNAAAERAIMMKFRGEAEIHMLAEMERNAFFGATCDATREAVCKVLDRTFPESLASFGAAKPEQEDEAEDETNLPITPYAAAWTWTRTEGVHAYI